MNRIAGPSTETVSGKVWNCDLAGQQAHSVSATMQRLFARGRVRHGTGGLA